VAVGVHLAYHVDNDPMARRLAEALPEGRPLVVLGDFNTWPGRPSYARLAGGALRDACPGAPPTTPIARRVDLVLVSDGVRVTRTLDRRRAFESFGVRSFFDPVVLHHALTGRGGATCPVSDHLPEGAVIVGTGSTSWAPTEIG
jgi:hypothetical protein